MYRIIPALHFVKLVLMIDCGLNVFGFDLAMESFNRVKTDRAALYETIPDVFSYEHENGLIVFVKKEG